MKKIYIPQAFFNLSILVSMLGVTLSASAQSQTPIFRTTSASIDVRAKDLLKTLTLQEKISLLGYNSPAIERLQIPSYNWWNEGLHGVARAGEATVFPQAIALAATFDTKLALKEADAISTEARAKHNMASKKQNYSQYLGINFWTPNINIFRDPRWGRGQETYGEDPFLTATIASAFIKGLQGTDTVHYKVAATAKHFAVHSGPESLRHSFNAVVDEKDLRETYLPAFKTLVDNNVASVMCGYNRLNSEPCCTSQTLLRKILTNEWGFHGQIVTDCWALDDIWLRHKTIPTRVEVAAEAIKAGINLDCSPILQQDALLAIENKLITEADIDKAILPTLRTQLKMGLYDDPCESPYTTYGIDSINNAYHTQLALEVALKSMVLIKNNGILPLNKDNIRSMVVAGENAASISALVGNYHGMSSNMVTFAEGIVGEAGPGIAVQYDFGCSYADTSHFGGIWASESADASVVVLGLNPLLEGEEGDAFLSNAGGDKKDLSIPYSHLLFLKKMRAAHKKPIIAVLTSGSAIDIAAIEPYADAIILAWYPGEQGGKALANLIFGKNSPSGRLPITFYQSVNDLPKFEDYSMQNRTYRYFKGQVAYPFGFGLSYTTFDYQWNKQPFNKYKAGDTIELTVKISNTGNYNSDEVIQAYIQYPNLERMPIRELKAFDRVNLKAGETKTVNLKVNVSDLKKWDLSKNQWKLYNGTYQIQISRNSETPILTQSFTIK